ncbi:MAG: ABC transporter permease, partial [Parvibaculaceae bacterium]
DRVAHSRPFLDYERLPGIGSIDGALRVAIAVTALAWWFLSMSRVGFMLRCLQANEKMAGLVGLPVLLLTVVAVGFSGAVAGIAGVVVTTEIQGRLTTEFFVGYGFSGILIAFLARNHPLAAAFVAFLFSTLVIAGQSLQVFYHIPFAMVQLIQALVVMCVAASEFFIRYRIIVVR